MRLDSHANRHTLLLSHALAGDTLYSLSEIIRSPSPAIALNRLLLLNRPPPPSSAYEDCVGGQAGYTRNSCWGGVCGMKRVLLLAAAAATTFLSLCTTPHPPQPPAFVLDGYAAAVAFPDVLPLEVGTAVKLGIMRQIAPGDV